MGFDLDMWFMFMEDIGNGLWLIGQWGLLWHF